MTSKERKGLREKTSRIVFVGVEQAEELLEEMMVWVKSVEENLSLNKVTLKAAREMWIFSEIVSPIIDVGDFRGYDEKIRIEEMIAEYNKSVDERIAMATKLMGGEWK